MIRRLLQRIGFSAGKRDKGSMGQSLFNAGQMESGGFATLDEGDLNVLWHWRTDATDRIGSTIWRFLDISGNGVPAVADPANAANVIAGGMSGGLDLAQPDGATIAYDVPDLADAVAKRWILIMGKVLSGGPTTTTARQCFIDSDAVGTDRFILGPDGGTTYSNNIIAYDGTWRNTGDKLPTGPAEFALLFCSGAGATGARFDVYLNGVKIADQIAFNDDSLGAPTGFMASNTKLANFLESDIAIALCIGGTGALKGDAIAADPGFGSQFVRLHEYVAALNPGLDLVPAGLL